MKKIHLILTKADPQAKPNSREARRESLLARICTGRSVKAMTGAAILSTTLWLAGCSDTQGEAPKNPDANNGNGSERTAENVNQTKEQGSVVEFRAETAEQAEEAAHKAAFTMLKGSFENLLDDRDAVFMSGEEANVYAGLVPDDQLYEGFITNRDEGFLTAEAEEDIEEGRVYTDVIYSKYEGNSEASTLAASISEKTGDETETILLTFKRNAPEAAFDEASAREMVTSIENGDVSLSPMSVEYVSSEGGIEDADIVGWNSSLMGGDPLEGLENMNEIWHKYAEVTGNKNLAVVENIPDIPTSVSAEQYSDSSNQSSGTNEVEEVANENPEAVDSPQYETIAMKTRALAVGILNEFIEGDYEEHYFAPGETPAIRDLPMEEHYGYYTNYGDDPESVDVQIDVVDTKHIGEDQRMLGVVIREDLLDKYVVASFVPDDNFDLGVFTVEELKEQIEGGAEFLEPRIIEASVNGNFYEVDTEYPDTYEGAALDEDIENIHSVAEDLGVELQQ